MKTIENVIKVAGLKELSGKEMLEVSGGNWAHYAGQVFGHIANALDSWMNSIATYSIQAK
jgi:hypothetical protein